MRLQVMKRLLSMSALLAQPVALAQSRRVLRYVRLMMVPQGPILLAKQRTETHTRLLDHKQFLPRL